MQTTQTLPKHVQTPSLLLLRRSMKTLKSRAMQRKLETVVIARDGLMMSRDQRVDSETARQLY